MSSTSFQLAAERPWVHYTVELCPELTHIVSVSFLHSTLPIAVTYTGTTPPQFQAASYDPTNNLWLTQPEFGPLLNREYTYTGIRLSLWEWLARIALNPTLLDAPRFNTWLTKKGFQATSTVGNAVKFQLRLFGPGSNASKLMSPSAITELLAAIGPEHILVSAQGEPLPELLLHCKESAVR